MASDFDFRHRFWLITVVFCVGFSAYAVDHVNVVARLVTWVGVDPSSRLLVGRIIFATGAALTILNALIRTWATAYLRGKVVHDSALHVEKIVADGPYRYVRNPLYFGNLLLAAGLGLLASTVGWLIIVTGMLIITLRLITSEEEALLQAADPAYSAYFRTVPRLLPAVHPASPPGQTRAHWVEGFTSELPAWAFAAAMILFAITLDLRVAYLTVLGAIALQIGVKSLRS